jgi:hypothetical protein
MPFETQQAAGREYVSNNNVDDNNQAASAVDVQARQENDISITISITISREAMHVRYTYRQAGYEAGLTPFQGQPVVSPRL